MERKRETLAQWEPSRMEGRLMERPAANLY